MPPLSSRRPLENASPHHSGEPEGRSTCSLLQLPAEIRNAIYVEVLQVRSGADARAVTRRDLLDAPDADLIELGHAREPALAQTCHQIREESLSVFFAENEFGISSRGVWVDELRPFDPRSKVWLKRVDSHVRCIRSITFRSDTFGHKPKIHGRLGIKDGELAVIRVAGVRFGKEDKAAQDYLDSIVHRSHEGNDKVKGLSAHDIMNVASLLVGGGIGADNRTRAKSASLAERQSGIGLKLLYSPCVIQ